MFYLLFGSFIPGTWFTAYRTDIDLYVIKILFITTLIVYFVSFFFFNYKDFSKENIIDIFSSTLLLSLIFFSFLPSKLVDPIYLKQKFLKFQTEISLLLTLLIGLAFFYFSFKQNKIFIRFISILLPLLLIINLTNSFFFYQRQTKFLNIQFFKRKNF